MSTEDLRAELAGADPAADAVAPDVMDRVPVAEVPAGARRRRWPRTLLAVAAVAAVGLIGLSTLPGILSGSGTDDSGPVQSTGAVGTESARTAPADTADGTSATTDTGTTGTPTMVRTAAVLVGTEDPARAADEFVRTITALGGQVTSQTVVTQGSAGPDGREMTGPMMTGTETTSSMPWPWYPTGPGIWLSVQVPADQYQQAVAAARASGDVVRLEQTAYDAGAQIADTDARVKALESSLARLRSLMDDAESVADVISLEDAIATRQAELDGLRAQQRQLRNQTQMSEISLTLMTPDDAAAVGDTSPSDAWVIAVRWVVVALLAMAAGALVYRWILRRR